MGTHAATCDRVMLVDINGVPVSKRWAWKFRFWAWKSQELLFENITFFCCDSDGDKEIKYISELQKWLEI